MNLTRTIATLVAAAALVIITGCGKNATNADNFNYKDGNASLVSSELNDMGSVEQPQAAAAKTFVDAGLPVEVVITPFHYDPACGGFIRTATKTFDDTSDVRTRIDTVYFFAAGVKLDSSARGLGIVDSIYHVRSVTKNRNGNVVNVRLDMNINITRNGSDTMSLKSGTISGTYNGFEFRTATVTNVTRHRVGGVWGFPVSGAIHIDRTLRNIGRTIDIVFNGDGTATATIIRESDGKEWVITVDVVTAAERDR